jgi:hypothetical protein
MLLPDLINTAAATATAIGAFLVFLQLRQNKKWVRLEKSHEILNDLRSGIIEDTLETLEKKFRWDVLHENKTYDDIVIGLPIEEIKELDRVLRRLFRRFEAIFISMHHKIVEEQTCREYIFSLFNTIYKSSTHFVLKEREKRKEPRVFLYVERYGRKWGAESRRTGARR